MSLKQLVTATLILMCGLPAHAKELTLLYTNDIESVYEPVEAFWIPEIHRIGGIPHLSTLIDTIRLRESNSLLLDAGDIFTGSLSKATEGELVFDIYSAMGYDAVNLGNHEFEYGWRILRRAMQRARFPVLSANIFFEDTDVAFAREYTILEVDDLRVGLIGIMGIDAFINTMMISNRDGLVVKSPAAVIQPIIDHIRDEVDMVVVLTHQNKTAPMQTDKEADPQVQRGFDEDFALAGELSGVDMIIGGHSDHGLWEPVKHPKTGTLIGLTFGQGKYLGYARFEIDQGKKPMLLEGKLIPVDADKYPANPRIQEIIESGRQEHKWLGEVAGQLSEQAVRKYYRESSLGNLMADILREYTGADVGFIPSGAIRADLEAGPVTVEQLLNVFPFNDTIATLTLSGEVLRQVLEKSLALDYGIVQISGVKLQYESTRPPGERLINIKVGDDELDLQQTYTLTTGSFTATGGENYSMFQGLPVKQDPKLVSSVFVEHFRAESDVKIPAGGRQIDIAR